MIEIFLKSIIIIFTVISTGLISNKYFFKFNNFQNFSELGLLGIIVLSIISFLLHFLFPLNDVISNFIYIFPLFFILTEKFSQKKFLEFSKFCLIFSILTLIYLSYSNFYRPDAGWYHLPFSRLVSDYKIIVGAASLHPMFGTTAILQYLSSVFHNFILGANGVLFVNPIILILFLMFFFNNFVRESQPILKFFSLLILFAIFIEMNRNSELGNDAPGYLFYFYLIYVFLRSNLIEGYKKSRFKFLSLISVFCFFIKSLYLFTLAIPLFIFIKEKLYYKKINYFNTANFVLIAWIIKNLIVTGCLIYPINFTCSDKLSWYSSNSKFEIAAKNTSQFSELHSKGWPDFSEDKQYYLNYDDQLSDKNKFLNNFNWLSEYINQGKNYNIIKKIDFLISTLLIFLFLSFFTLKKNIKKNFIKKKRNLSKINYNFLLSSSLLFTVIVLFKLPDARYFFGYLLISIFLIIIYFIDVKLLFLKKKISNISNIFLIVLFSVFVLKNSLKIVLNSESSTHLPNLYSSKIIFDFRSKKIGDNKVFNIYYTDKFYSKFASKKLCIYHKSPCIQNRSILDQFDVITANGYLILKLKKLD